MPQAGNGRRNGCSTHAVLMRPIAYCVMLAWCDASLANPTGPQVAAGAATFATAGKTLNVTNAPGTIINWNAFSIGAGERTRFLQQNAASAVLNRVVGADSSSILGTLSSNGRVLLINPNGIVFGAGAVVDTASFIASTLNMSDRDFLSGKLRFEGGGHGALRNEATIRASGDIVLVGPEIQNAGIIRSSDGSVLLAAGKALTITSPDAHGVTFTLQAPGDSVVNLGSISAANAGSMFAGTLRHSGDITAGSAHLDSAGRIVIVAQKDATIESRSSIRANGAGGGRVIVQSGDTTLIAGTIEAVGSAGGGGNIQVLGNKVGVLDGASVDASGSSGGGTILIGGDLRGRNFEIQNAFSTYIGAEAAIKADATVAGNGGKVIVWSDEATRVYGSISARGAGGGSGGFVETSGHYLDAPITPNLGAGGTWLLDPRNFEVASTGTINNTGAPTFTATGDDSKILNTQINSQLDSGVSVILDTNTGGGTQAGNILVSAPITKNTNNVASLTFNAQNDVTINADITLASGAFNVTTLNAGSTMTVNSSVRTGSAAAPGAIVPINLNLAGGLVVQSSSATTAQLTAQNGMTISARSLSVLSSSTGIASIGNGVEAQSITINNAGSGSGIDVMSTGTGGATINHAFFTGTCTVSCPPVIAGPQTITINDGDRLRVIGGGGAARVESASNQTILLQGTGLNALEIGSPTAVATSEILSGATQSITAGQAGQTGSVTLRGGLTDTRRAAIIASGSGSQSVTTPGTIRVIGGSAATGTSGHDAVIQTTGTASQNIDANGVVLQAGGGADNQADLRSSGTGGNQTITVGAGGITLAGGSGNSSNGAEIVQSSAGQAQTLTVNGGGAIKLRGGSGTDFNEARIRTAGPTQTITFTAGGDLELIGGTNGTLNRATITQASTASSSTQTISGATGISVTGGANGGGIDASNNRLGNYAEILTDFGGQSVTTSSGGITLTGGGGSLTGNHARIVQGVNPNALVAGTSQVITINNGGAVTLLGGSSAQSNVVGGTANPNNFSRGSFASVQSNGDTQRLDFTNGGALSLTGGTVGSNNSSQIILRFGADQIITGAPAITLTGGASGGTQNGAVNEGNRARIVADIGNQNIAAGAIALTGGAGGLNNSAQIIAQAVGASQTLNATGIAITGGAGGGGFVTAPSYSTRGNFAQIVGFGDQTVGVGAGGIVMNGGGGPLTDNSASLAQLDTAAARRQQITVNGGGPITLTGGSSAATSFGANGSGSHASIVANGGAGQTIDFATAGSAVSLTGGTVGTGNSVAIRALNGQQTITGSPTIAMIGGASGGLAGDGNTATIQASVGTQTLTAGVTQLTGGPGGVDNGVSIRSPNQNLTINGNLTLTGSTGGSGATGARIGPLINQAGTTSLTVNGGDVTLNGGGVAASGAAIGISRQATTMQTGTFTVNASGDISLNAGTAGPARIGQPASLLGGGDVSVTAGGNITLTGSAAAEASINTAGNVTMRADAAGKSITQAGANALVRANMLIASAHSGILMNGNNAVTSLNATNTTANGIQFTQAPGLLLTLMGMPQTGGNVVVSADDMNITAGLTAGTSTVVLRPTTLTRPVNIEITPTANSLSLSPAELNFVTAGRLEVGRLDGTGALSVLSGLASSDINAATLALLSGTDVLIAGSFGGFGAEFNNNFEARANNNLTVSNNSLLFANGQSVMFVADNDASGAGNLAFANSSGSGRTVLAGTSPGNTANMTLQGVDVTISGDNGMNVTLRGSGTQTVTAADEMLVQAGTAAGAQAGLRADEGAQNITARGIAVIAGAGGSNNSASIRAGAAQTLVAGAGGIAVTGGGGSAGNSAVIEQLSTAGTQAIALNGGGAFRIIGGTGTGSGNSAQVRTTGNTAQQITFAGGGAMLVAGGTSGSSNFAQVTSGANQTISGASGITASGGASGGGSTTGNFAQISSALNQAISVGAAGISLTGGSGTLTDNFAQIVQNGSAAGSNQNITFTGGGSLVAQGGSSAGTNGNAGSSAEIAANGLTQSIVFSTGGNISLTGGTVGSRNDAQLRNSNNGGTQTITGVAGITLRGGASGGTEGPASTNSFGNFAQLRGNGIQDITVGSGGITAIGGGGNFDNFAQVRQGPPTGGPTPGTRQAITVTGGGNVTLQGGSTSGTASANGNGGYGRIRGEGDSQTIAFSAGGAIRITGGTVGTSNHSEIRTDSGTQTITGSPTVTMVAGTSGGASSDGNFARIRSGVSQTLALGTVQMTGGAGGVDNFSTIDSPTQNITVSGNLTMTGSGGGTGAAGTRIGGIRDGATNLGLGVTGNVTLNGGAVTGGGSAIGPSGNSATPQNAAITLTAGGDVTLNGGTPAATRIGQPQGLVGGGNVSVISGGSVTLAGGSGIRTTSNVTVRADGAGQNISESADSTIAADRLTASAGGLIDLAGTNRINTLELSTTGAGIAFSSAQPLSVDANNFSTPTGTQTLSFTTTGASSDITIFGTGAGDDNVVFVSGRDVIIAGGSTLGANSAVISGAGALQFTSGTVTLNTPVITTMPVNITGATVNFNGATLATTGAILSSGTLQGSGDVSVTGGPFTWSGGRIAGSGTFNTAGTTSNTAAVTLETRTWNNLGTVNQTAGGQVFLANNAVINNLPGATWNVASGPVTAIDASSGSSASFNNAGTLNIAGSHTFTPLLTNTGQLDLASGVFDAVLPTNAGRINIASGATLRTRSSLLNSGPGTIAGGGTIDLAGVSGAGTLTNDGHVAPGSSPGDLTIFGNYTQTSGGTLVIEVAGTNPGTEYDVFNVNGVATLGGNLVIVPIGGYTPPPGQSFAFLTYSRQSGDFERVSGGYTTSPGVTRYQFSPSTMAMNEVLATMASKDVITLNSQSSTTTTAVEQETETRKDEKVDRKEVSRECR